MSKDADDDLRDLTPEEAQELRDFLEKRRWFEGKLKLLEETPPIYPFLHPVILYADQNEEQHLQREGESSSQWRLPSFNQVKEWQKEWDSMEAEILRFDGGDLGRMKEKTRAATQLPLTPPSTHLVSITLDLIVLVDRLLTLLRHRRHLLELVTDRLHWDHMRWQIMAETVKIRQEVAEIVQDKGRWHPVMEPSTVDRRLGTSHGDREKSQVNFLSQTPPRTPNLGSVSSVSSELGSMHISSPKMDRSTSSPNASPRLNNTPKRSLHIPLLHSRLVNLIIRHQNLMSNQVKRSGILLDKMIDIAGPLKDLGGVSGPSAVKATDDSGAVPDELLDVQDGLEEEVKELGGRVAWCKQLEQHWKLSEAHHAASLDALHHGQQALDILQSYLSQPATSEYHRELAQRLQDAQRRLPAPIEQSFLNPSHPAYPENDQHNAEVASALTETYAKAQGVLRKCQSGIDWYEKLVQEGENLAEQRQQVIAARVQLQHHVDLLSEILPLECEDPLKSIASYEISEKEAGKKIIEAQQHSDSAVPLSQKLTLGITRYQNTLRKNPLDGYEVNDEIIHNAQQENETLLELLEVASPIIESAQEINSVLSSLHPVLSSIRNIETDLSALEAGTSLATSQAAWPTCQEIDTADLSQRVGELEHQFEQEVQRPLRDISQETAANRPITYMKELSADLGDRQIGLRRTIDILRKVQNQATSVKAVDQDVAQFLQKVERLHDSMLTDSEDAKVNIVNDGIGSDIEALEGEFKVWSSNLAGSIPFLSSHGENLPIDIPFTTGPSTIPLASSPIVSMPDDHQSLDLLRTDSAVRNHLNKSTLLVASAIADCKADHSRRIKEQWTKQCHEAAQHIDHVISQWQRIREKATEDIARMNDLTEGTVQNVQDLKAHLDPLLVQQRETNQAALGRLEKLVAEKPSSGPDVEIWDSAIGPARSAVEVVTIDIGKVETLLGALIDRVSSSNSVAENHSMGDVFGPLPTESHQDANSDTISRIRQLQEELDSMNIELIAKPSSDQDSKNATWRRLPDYQTVQIIHVKLAGISQRVAKTDAFGNDAASSRLEDLTKCVESCQRLLPYLDRLADIHNTISDCDSTFSTLAEAIDHAESVEVREAMTAAMVAFRHVTDPASGINGDWRLIEEIERLSHSWEELQALAKPKPDSSEMTSRPPSAASTRSNVIPASRLPRLTSSLPRAINRSTSNRPMSSPLVDLSSSVRNRAVSDTPTRTRVSSLKGNIGTPRASLPSANGSRQRLSSLPRPVRLSMTGKVTPVKKKYVADPKSKLDVEVGKVVNGLNVHVPVRPVGLNSSDEWKDQSGQYWIGAEGRAKLCFCRILRSRTVMVRVGGGWVELSKFLSDHFAEAVGAWQTPFDSPIRPSLSASSSSTSIFDSNGSFASPPPSQFSSSLASIASDRTPVRKTIGLPDEQYLSPDKLPKSTSNRSLSSHPNTPKKLHSPSGAGSPLSAFQFMRRASESPSVREKEKEKFHGRRSILGKEASMEG